MTRSSQVAANPKVGVVSPVKLTMQSESGFPFDSPRKQRARLRSKGERCQLAVRAELLNAHTTRGTTVQDSTFEGWTTPPVT